MVAEGEVDRGEREDWDGGAGIGEEIRSLSIAQ